MKIKFFLFVLLALFLTGACATDESWQRRQDWRLECRVIYQQYYKTSADSSYVLKEQITVVANAGDSISCRASLDYKKINSPENSYYYLYLFQGRYEKGGKTVYASPSTPLILKIGEWMENGVYYYGKYEIDRETTVID